MGSTWRIRLLLASSFLTCICADDAINTSTTTITKSSEELSAGVTLAVSSSVSPGPAHSTLAPPPDFTEKTTTRAPSTPPPPQTTAVTTPTPTGPSPSGSSPPPPPAVQASTPSAVPQTSTVTGSESTARATTTTLTSTAHSTPPLPVESTVLGLAPPLNTGSPVQSSSPRPRTTFTVPQTTGNTGTTRATHIPAPGTGIALTDTTTKQDSKEAIGTTAVVTSKSNSSPDQRPTDSSTPQPTVAQHFEASTSKPPSVTTPGGSGPDLVPLTTDSKVQTTDHTTAQTTVPFTTALPMPQIFSYSLNKGHQAAEEKELVSLCQQLMGSLEDGNCTISFRHHNGKVLFDSAEITGKVKTTIVTQHFEDITKKPSDNRTLITILASCGALLIMIVILAVCASQHRKPYGNQLHLTEELQTVENGYHDNPTLEVMEVGVDIQEKKSPPPPSLNNGGDFNDSWIVPIDNLLKEEGPDVEDTHL